MGDAVQYLARLEFELAYYDVAVQYVSHFTTRNPLSTLCMTYQKFTKNYRVELVQITCWTLVVIQSIFFLFLTIDKFSSDANIKSFYFSYIKFIFLVGFFFLVCLLVYFFFLFCLFCFGFRGVDYLGGVLFCFGYRGCFGGVVFYVVCFVCGLGRVFGGESFLFVCFACFGFGGVVLGGCILLVLFWVWVDDFVFLVFFVCLFFNNNT